MEDKTFIDGLSAQMCKMEKDQYVQFHEKCITDYDQFSDMVQKVKVKSVEDYEKAMSLKSVLSSMYCYTFNHDKKEDFEKFSNLEGDLGKKLAKFARNFARVHGETASLVRYLCHQGGWSYRNENVKEIIRHLTANNCLFKNESGAFFVTGLHLAVGDNVFGVSRRTGRDYRLYVKTCVIQAFYVTGHWHTRLENYESDELFPKIPILPPYYYKTGTGDGKGSARVYLTYKDKECIQSKYLEV